MPPRVDRSELGQCVTCLIVEDHADVRDALETVLAGEGIDIVGVAGTPREAIESLAALAPQLAVVDLALPGLDAIEFVQRAIGAAPDTRIVVFTGAISRRGAAAALEGGVRAVVLKDSLATELLTAIDIVLDGGTYLASRLQGDEPAVNYQR